MTFSASQPYRVYPDHTPACLAAAFQCVLENVRDSTVTGSNEPVIIDSSGNIPDWSLTVYECAQLWLLDGTKDCTCDAKDQT